MTFQRIYLPTINRIDLESIEEKLLALGTASSYSVTVDGVELKNLSEVTNNRKKAQAIQLVQSKPFTSVVMNDSESYIMANGDSDEKVVGELIEILQSKQRLSLWHSAALLPTFLTVVITFMVAISVANFVVSFDESTEQILTTLILISGVTSILASSLILQTRLNHFSNISLSKHKKSFFTKYQKQIIFAVFSGMIGAIAGTILTFVVDSLLS